MHQRSASLRQKQLRQLFESAGFERQGSDFVRDAGELRWTLFFWVSPDSDGDRSGVSFTARRIGSADTNANYLVNGNMSELPSTSWSDYVEYDDCVEDPLIVDTREVLLPLIARLSSQSAVLDARIAGELGSTSQPLSDRIADGWVVSKRVGSEVHVARAETLAANGSWSSTDRWYFRRVGMSIAGPFRNPVRVTLFDRIFHTMTYELATGLEPDGRLQTDRGRRGRG